MGKLLKDFQIYVLILTILWKIEGNYSRGNMVSLKFPSQLCRTVCKKAGRNLNDLDLLKVDSLFVCLLEPPCYKKWQKESL